MQVAFIATTKYNTQEKEQNTKIIITQIQPSFKNHVKVLYNTTEKGKKETKYNFYYKNEQSHVNIIQVYLYLFLI